MRKWSTRLWILATVAAAGLPARAATVFDNYTGPGTGYGAIEGLGAAAFTPTANFDFTGAAADFSAGTPPYTLGFSLYGSSAGQPGTLLWSAIDPGAIFSGLVSESYNGPPIQLDSGTTYFLGIYGRDATGIFVFWLAGGSSSESVFANSGGNWYSVGTSSLQFEIFGDPITSPVPVISPMPITSPVPEPASLALLGAGLAGIGLTRRRRA